MFDYKIFDYKIPDKFHKMDQIVMKLFLTVRNGIALNTFRNFCFGKMQQNDQPPTVMHKSA